MLPFVQKIFFPHWISLPIFGKTNWHYKCGSISGISICSIDLFIFVARYTLSWLILLYDIKNQAVHVFNFVLFQLRKLLQIFCIFIYILESPCQFLQKRLLGFWDCIEEITLGIMAILTVLSSSICEHNISFCLFKTWISLRNFCRF